MKPPRVVRGKMEISHDCLRALAKGPHQTLNQTELFIKARICSNTADRFLAPLIESGFIKTWDEPRVRFKKFEVEEAIERGELPTHLIKRMYEITPKGFTLLHALNKAKKILEDDQ